jgi:Arc/MetJ-type ribon-helix-helix transcriptional regulator
MVIHRKVMIMNINLGAPYEAAIKSIIEKGYAGSQTEVIRQAILAYERMIEEEELALVHKAVEIEMQDIEAQKSKTYSFEDIKKIVKG